MFGLSHKPSHDELAERVAELESRAAQDREHFTRRIAGCEREQTAASQRARVESRSVDPPRLRMVESSKMVGSGGGRVTVAVNWANGVQHLACRARELLDRPEHAAAIAHWPPLALELLKSLANLGG